MRTATVYVVACDEDDAEIGVKNRNVEQHDNAWQARLELPKRAAKHPDLAQFLDVFAVEMTMAGRAVPS